MEIKYCTSLKHVCVQLQWPLVTTWWPGHKVAWAISDRPCRMRRKRTPSTSCRFAFFRLVYLWSNFVLNRVILLCCIAAGRRAREDKRVFRVSSTFDTAGCGSSKEDERAVPRPPGSRRAYHWAPLASYSDSAPFDGQRLGYAQRYQRHTLCAN